MDKLTLAEKLGTYPVLITGFRSIPFSDGSMLESFLKEVLTEPANKAIFIEGDVALKASPDNNPATQASFCEVFTGMTLKDLILKRNRTAFGCLGDEVRITSLSDTDFGLTFGLEYPLIDGAVSVWGYPPCNEYAVSFGLQSFHEKRFSAKVVSKVSRDSKIYAVSCMDDKDAIPAADEYFWGGVMVENGLKARGSRTQCPLSIFDPLPWHIAFDEQSGSELSIHSLYCGRGVNNIIRIKYRGPVAPYHLKEVHRVTHYRPHGYISSSEIKVREPIKDYVIIPLPEAETTRRVVSNLLTLVRQGNE